ncbi:MAG: RICIN domain-containing protein [Hominimerdicola sp.]
MNIKKCIILFLVISIMFSMDTIPVTAYSTAPLIVSGQIYYIKNKNSGQYLDVSGGCDANKQNVQQWGMNGTDAQKWEVVHTGNGIYKLVSQVGSKNKVLDVYQRKDSNKTNIEIYSDSGANNSGRRFRIIRNSDGYSYRIMSKCSNYTKAVTVKDASCAMGKNVFQYDYNKTGNDEWIFEPVEQYNTELAVNYAKKNFDKRTMTYPDMDGLGGDCTNFVSQCLLAGGIHFQNDWYVYKKNKSNSRPANTNQLDYSWTLEDPSPWISAKQFNKYFDRFIKTQTYKGSYILSNPNIIYNLGYYKGDVILIMDGGMLFGSYLPFHSMIITDYGKYNGYKNFRVTYHSNDSVDVNLLEIAKIYPDSYFRFYEFA